MSEKSSNNIVLCEAMYFGPIPFYRELSKAEILELEQKENYNKSSYRNRMEIATSNGKLVLSIPLKKGKHQGQPIRDVQIDNHYHWKNQHWKSLQTAYSKSPYFEFYIHLFQPLFDNSKTHKYLWDFNLDCFEQLLASLPIPVQIKTSRSFTQPDADHIKDFRNKFLPKNIHQYNALQYEQIFEDRTGFIPHLSILDLLFCKGPESVLILNQKA